MLIFYSTCLLSCFGKDRLLLSLLLNDFKKKVFCGLLLVIENNVGGNGQPETR